MSRRQPPSKNAVRAPGRDQCWRVAGICLVLAGITFAVFGQTLHHEFVNFDDNEYVYQNPVVARGLTLKGIAWAFTGIHASNWHPLTWLSHMLDCQLYGLRPGGHHLTNVLLHTATVIALFLVLRQMTGALWRSAFVAAVFAIHPLRVESVAWVAERKDVLSGLFFMLTIGAYIRYARQPWSPSRYDNVSTKSLHEPLSRPAASLSPQSGERAGRRVRSKGILIIARYGLVMLLFAMGLMCKSMLVTLPVVAVAAGLLAITAEGIVCEIGSGKGAVVRAFRQHLRCDTIGANRNH